MKWLQWGGSKNKIKTYWFKWRRCGRLFWSRKRIMGHKWFADQNKMILYLTNGGIYEIPLWTDCGCELGKDWAKNAVEVKKEKSEEESEE